MNRLDWVIRGCVCVALHLAAGQASAQSSESEAWWEGEPGPARGDELIEAVPDLKVDPTPATLALTPGAGLRVPYQILNVNLGIEYYPAPWLRTGLVYGFGFTLKPSPDHQVGTMANHYVEALIGLRIGSWAREREIEIGGTLRQHGQAVRQVLTAAIPASLSVFLEGGALAWSQAYLHCLENCEDESTSRFQVEPWLFAMPGGGVRVVYQYSLRSEARQINNRRVLQFFAHVFAPPVNTPTYPLYQSPSKDWDPDGPSVRVGATVPPIFTCVAEMVFGWSCAQSSVALGYAAVSGTAWFEFNLEFPFYF